jgi:hypothetical protein
MTTPVLNIDLHCHSTVSDGALAPRDVAQRAHANGVDVWALTDHDEIGGLAEAAAMAGELGMRFATGVEISVTWAGLTVHIVGLRFDPSNVALADGLRKTRSGRAERARRIGERLAEMGMPGAYEGALPFAGNPELISRTHFARYLVEAGYCPDVQTVFTKHLGDDRPGHVPMQWATLAEAVGCIRGATSTRRCSSPRCSTNSCSWAAWVSKSRPAATPLKRRASMPRWRAAMVSWPRAGRTSIARKKAAWTWAGCPRCRPT